MPWCLRGYYFSIFFAEALLQALIDIFRDQIREVAAERGHLANQGRAGESVLLGCHNEHCFDTGDGAATKASRAATKAAYATWLASWKANCGGNDSYTELFPVAGSGITYADD